MMDQSTTQTVPIHLYAVFAELASHRLGKDFQHGDDKCSRISRHSHVIQFAQ